MLDYRSDSYFNVWKQEKGVIVNIPTEEEKEIIRNLHLRGKGIHVIAHAPQEDGDCHSFTFLRGVLLGETYEEAYNRVKPEILQYIEEKCGRPCVCNSGKPKICFTLYGGKY